MDIENFIRQSPYFKGISDSNIAAIAKICMPRNLARKEILFTEGEKGHSLYFCANGKIQIYKTSPEGREVVIRIIQSGEIFAEVILFEQSHYPVTAMALTESTIFEMSRQAFYQLFDYEDFRIDFIRMLMKKQRYLTEQIKYLSTYDVEDRLFLFLEEHYGRKMEINPKISKKDMAAAIGTIPETFSRLLLRLKLENKLNWEGKIIRIQAQAWEKK